MQQHRTIIIALLAALCLMLAGCGPATAELSAGMTEFEFSPASWTVPSGAEVTLTLTNNGSVDHNWVLMVLGYLAEAPFNEQDQENVYFETTVEPGQTETVTFTAPESPGTYQVVCSIAGHLEAGMEGTLTVE